MGPRALRSALPAMLYTLTRPPLIRDVFGM